MGEIERLPLTKNDRALVDKWCGGFGLPADVAASVKRQGWISEKQRRVLENGDKQKAPRGGMRGGAFQNYREDYDECDHEIGDYENCAGWWK